MTCIIVRSATTKRLFRTIHNDSNIVVLWHYSEMQWYKTGLRLFMHCYTKVNDVGATTNDYDTRNNMLKIQSNIIVMLKRLIRHSESHIITNAAKINTIRTNNQIKNDVSFQDCPNRSIVFSGGDSNYHFT